MEIKEKHEKQEKIPTLTDVAEVCKDVLDVITIASIVKAGSIWGAIGFAFSALLQAGVLNPEKFLMERGILE